MKLIKKTLITITTVVGIVLILIIIFMIYLLAPVFYKSDIIWKYADGKCINFPYQKLELTTIDSSREGLYYSTTKQGPITNDNIDEYTMGQDYIILKKLDNDLKFAVTYENNELLIQAPYFDRGSGSGLKSGLSSKTKCTLKRSHPDKVKEFKTFMQNINRLITSITRS